MMVSVASFMFSSCTKEGPQGPAGKDGVNGINGVNGVNGLNGQDANSSCLVCHTVANFDTKISEYHFSKHYLGTSSARNTKFCARCHTSEGFKQIITNGIYVCNNDMPDANRINCTTCHKHKGFDFTGDTVSMILATTTPVFLNYNKNQTSTDFGAINNLCVTCHQIRGATSLVYSDTVVRPIITNRAFDQLPYFPFKNTVDNDTVQYKTGRSFSVHDGNQSNLFAGINGYEYQGKTYTRLWQHSTNACTDCHMNTYNAADTTGGHTLWANKAECTSCHGSDKLTPIQNMIKIKLVELAEILTTKKVFKKTVNATTGAISYSAMATHDFNGKLYPNTQTAGNKFASLVSNNTVSPTTGLVIYGNMVKYAVDADYAIRIGRPWKYGELGAAYNYAYINSELSLGVHNYGYALALLQNSIDWLNAN